VASPRRDRGGATGGTARRAVIDFRAARPPQSANDNATGFALRLMRMLPLAVALGFLLAVLNLLS
jgi:hypothetical protein